MKMNRRNVVKAGLAGASVLAMPYVARSAMGTVRIGLITPLSGGGELYGNYIKSGAEIAAERLMKQGALGGAKIELVIRDDKGTPDGALTAFREITGDGVKLIAQGLFTSGLLATLPLLKEVDGTLVMVGPGSLPVTHEAFTPHAFRMGYTAPTFGGGQGALMAKKHPEANKWAFIRTDLSSVEDISGYFRLRLKEEAEKAGRSVELMDEILVPYKTADFRNQASQIAGSGADALFTTIQGADNITFYKQARGFNLDQRIGLMCDSGNELAIARAMGKTTPKSLWSWTGWYPYADPDNTASIEAVTMYKERTGEEYPSGFFGFAHDSILSLVDGLEKAGSTDSAKMIPAIESSTPTGCLGKISYRPEDHTFAGLLTFIRFGADESDPKGWKVFEVEHLNGADYLEPPTPGKKFER
ncbi:MAG: ABC transporter substrate-binding protein [Nitratireductor sp.]|nr:ABC transporter substrate-binding protein [Nitratireductor sp.]